MLFAMQFGEWQRPSQLAGSEDAVPAAVRPEPGAILPRQRAIVLSASRRWWLLAAWIAAAVVFLAFLLRISAGARIDSDGANSALQAWDLVHGHVLLHGWIFGDATFYTFELPLIGVVEGVFGLGPAAVHVASSLVYLIVAALAVALAVTGSRGPARVARGAVAVTVLAAPLLTLTMVDTLVEEPDHPGTSAFMLASALLIDCLPRTSFT